jgi:hypothetical protein
MALVQYAAVCLGTVFVAWSAGGSFCLSSGWRGAPSETTSLKLRRVIYRRLRSRRPMRPKKCEYSMNSQLRSDNDSAFFVGRC